MNISRTGGVIGAASKRRARPLRKTGEIPAVRRIVLTMQQAGIFPIVVVIRSEEYDLKYQLAGDHVILLQAEDPEETPLIETAKIGLSYLYGKCENILFTPVNAPLFTAETILELENADADVAVPVFEGKPGHPVLIRDRVVRDILDFEGDEGLRGAFRSLGDRTRQVPVEDPGVISLNPTEEGLNDRIPYHNESLFHPSVRISLGNESQFFNERLKLLLFLIGDLKNVKLACDSMAISKGKAWSMINSLEKQLGFRVVARQQGGKRGGHTALTPEGELFLLRWQRYEEEVYQFTQTRYREIFAE